jgi:ABC-2 type transport system ATP-binding protein
MADAIQVTGLRKVYGTLSAVDGVDFTVPEGQVFSFLGPNGAGKTTAVEILEGLRKATSGEVRVLGLDPWKDGEKLHRLIGVIPQEFRFFERIHPAEAIRYYGTLFGKKVDAKVLLDRVALADKANDQFEKLSGGQKQKLGLALALVNEPKVCFLDEPTTGLDPQARRAIWDVIRQLKSEGKTVFLTTHYLEEAELLADQVAIITHGKIIARGTPEGIIRQFGRAERITVQGPPSLYQYLKSHLTLEVEQRDGTIQISIHDRQDVMTTLQAIEASGLPWKGFATAQDTLEDVFVHLVGQMDEGVVKPGALP